MEVLKENQRTLNHVIRLSGSVEEVPEQSKQHQSQTSPIQSNGHSSVSISEVLEKMSELLDKLEARVNSVGPDVKDPVVAKAAIADSRAKIAAATATVTAQSEKDYTLTITTESKVKADAQKMRDQLRADLQTTRQLVIDAKQSVANAIRNAKSSAGMKEGTASGQ